MALELFNTATKNDVYNNWYPKDSKAYVRGIVKEIQQKLGTETSSKLLRKDEIKEIIKYFGIPSTIDDDDFKTYVDHLKDQGEW